MVDGLRLPRHDVVAPPLGIVDQVLLVPDKQRARMPKVSLADRRRAVDAGLDLGKSDHSAVFGGEFPVMERQARVASRKIPC
jgi:hypothetical protein